MKIVENKTVSEQDIDFFKERKTTRLLKEYYSHKNKSIEELIDLKKNMELVKELNELLKDNEDDIALQHSKKNVLEFCLCKFKSIKKEDLELLDAEKKVENIRTSKKEEKKESTNNETNKIHETATKVLKKYYEMKGC